MGLLIRADLVASTEQMKQGWSLVKLMKVDKKASKDDSNYTNITLIFEGIQGPENSEENAGRSLRHMIAGKAVEANVSLVAERLLQLVQALTGIMDRKELINQEVEFENFIGQRVWVNVQNEINTRDNKAYLTCVAFTPENVVPF